MANVDTLTTGLNELDITLSGDKLEKFNLYKELLKEWNEKINITAIKDDRDIDIKHFLDSLTIFKTGLVEGNKKIMDIGTGGGFPGIPIKIVNDNAEVVLLDSLNKRLTFLNEVINKLKLRNISTLHGRAEDFAHEINYREKFDIVVSRAVASLNVLSELCLPYVAVGGYFIAMKGPGIEEEMENGKESIKILGGEIDNKYDVKLPLSDITHTLLVIKKITKTPTKYPRSAGKPKKNPL